MSRGGCDRQSVVQTRPYNLGISAQILTFPPSAIKFLSSAHAPLIISLRPHDTRHPGRQVPEGEGSRRAIINLSFMREDIVMTLSSPKMITWVIALVLGVIGILANLVSLPIVTAGFGFWLLVIAFVLLAAGSVVKGL